MMMLGDKNARRRFYALLRKVAPEYNWQNLAGGIRGTPRHSNNGHFPCFCPITAVVQNTKKPKKRFKLNQYIDAGSIIGLDNGDATIIASSADSESSFDSEENGRVGFNPQVRQALLRAVGLTK